MEKHLVPLIHVGVHRDITTTVAARVAEHEIPILQSVHGDSNVYPGDPTGEQTALDVMTEHDRLQRKYGEDHVRDAYGATAKGDIRRLILANATGTVEDEGYGIQLDGPDTPVERKHSLPASQVQRPEPAKRGRPAMSA